MPKATSDPLAPPPVDLAPLLALPPELADELARATRALDELEPFMGLIFERIEVVLKAVDAHGSEFVEKLRAMDLSDTVRVNVSDALPYLNGAAALCDRIFQLHERLGVLSGAEPAGAGPDDQGTS